MTRTLVAILFLAGGTLVGELFQGWMSRAMAPALLIIGILSLSAGALRRAEESDVRSTSPLR